MCIYDRSLVTYSLSLREGDRGSRVTLVGLGANVLLTSVKGVAGWYMNSAALLGSGHSLSGEHALATSCPSLSGAALLYVPLGVGGLSLSPSLACAPDIKSSQLTCNPMALTPHTY